MTKNGDRQFSTRAAAFGIILGLSLSLAFALINPGLIGVGPAIGITMAIALNEHAGRNRRH
jgi:hypothetical protein